MSKIALIGAGAIGRAWAIVFARARHRVALQSRTAETLARARQFINARLCDLQERGLIDEQPKRIAERIEMTTDVEAALDGAVYVQENAAEDLEAKRALFSRLDALSPSAVVIASSTSTLPASQFAAHLQHRERCLVAHPVNPPYLIPAVEISPAPFTRPEFVSSTVALLSSVGQSPIVLRKEIPGFVMNRLQSLLACEAVRLVEDGCVDVEDLDRAVKDGLGLRWSFMGPLETLDLNADGGFAKFAEVFAPIMHSIDASPAAAPRAWSPEGIAQIDRARREQVPLSRQHERIAWRDRQLMALVAHKRAMRKNDS